MKLGRYILATVLGMTTQIMAMDAEPTLLERVNVPTSIQSPSIIPPHIKVGVVDSGFDTQHSLLKMQLSTGYNGRDDNTNVDCSIQMPTFTFDSHGTHVAGIIAQIAPQSRIVPYKLGGGEYTSLRALLRNYKEIAKRNDIQIVNMSQHVYELLEYPEIYKAIVGIAKSGKLIIMSAGNHEEQYGITPKTDMLVQLASLPEVQNRVILVSASENILKREYVTSWSGTGHSAHDYFVTAPGYNIRSAIPTNKYAYKDGTSMAAPVVSAVLAQIMAQTNCSGDKARQLLFDGCVKAYGDRVLDQKLYGHGIVNLGNSIQIAMDEKKKQDEAMMERIRAAAKLLKDEADLLMKRLDQEEAALKLGSVKRFETQPERKVGQNMIHIFRQNQGRPKVYTPLPEVKKGNVQDLIKKFQK